MNMRFYESINDKIIVNKKMFYLNARWKDRRLLVTSIDYRILYTNKVTCSNMLIFLILELVKSLIFRYFSLLIFYFWGLIVAIKIYLDKS